MGKEKSFLIIKGTIMQNNNDNNKRIFNFSEVLSKKSSELGDRKNDSTRCTEEK